MSRFSHSQRQTTSQEPSRPPRAAAQRRTEEGISPATEPSAAVAHALHNPGRPLDAPLREAAEQRLGFDFGRVRVHTDERAAAAASSLQARAFTVGSHIVFGNSQYAPGSEAGRLRLSHELSHVMQQPPGSPVPSGPLELGALDSPHERQAQRLARAASPAEARGLLAGAGALSPAVVAREPKPGAAKDAPPSKEVAERQGRNAYPRNPRAAALHTKMILGTITKEEMSELRGVASFPENPRAAALYAKYDAGTIKPKELEELRGYFGQQTTRDSELRQGPGFAGGESPRAAYLRAQQAKGPLSREEQAELQGLNAYPDNPRAAALYKKKVLGEKMTPEEQAELQGFDTYPYNRRAAALHVKEVMRTITWPEWHELREENYTQSMGEFLIQLEGQDRKGTMWPEHRWVYERLRNNPKVRHRAMQIRQSGRVTFSVFD